MSKLLVVKYVTNFVDKSHLIYAPIIGTFDQENIYEVLSRLEL